MTIRDVLKAERNTLKNRKADLNSLLKQKGVNTTNPNLADQGTSQEIKGISIRLQAIKNIVQVLNADQHRRSDEAGVETYTASHGQEVLSLIDMVGGIIEKKIEADEKDRIIKDQIALTCAAAENEAREARALLCKLRGYAQKVLDVNVHHYNGHKESCQCCFCNLQRGMDLTQK